jgi:mannose/fructose/N-acetylgalactosamine-specific phosphotransferase system component IIB
MSIVLVRIDNRLLHGQVLEAWVPAVNANCIVVANDQAAAAPFQRTLMEAAVPRGIKVVVDSVAGSAQILRRGELDAYRVLLLYATSQDALAGFCQGVEFAELNLGNMHAGAGKMKLSCTIALAPEDIENLQQLEARGVRILSQCIPADRRRGWKKLLPDNGS